MAPSMRFLVHVDRGLPPLFHQFIEHLGTIERHAAGAHPSSSDVVVLDAATAVTDAGRELVRQAIESDRAVLLLDAGDEQKRALVSVTGFASQGPGAVYLVQPVRDHAGRQHFSILEQSFPSKLTLVFQEARGEGEGVNWRGEALETPILAEGGGPAEVPADELERFGDKVRERLLSPPAPPLRAQAIPPDLKWKAWVYTQCQCFTASGGRSSIGTPADQYISCQTTYEFEGYLNNYPETGAFQYLFLRQSGIFQTNGMAHDDKHTRGWYLTQLAPNFVAPGNLFYYQSSPANAAGKKTVTTSSSFTVNFETGGAGASYNFSKSETEDIYDWNVVQISGSSWRYAQAVPYPGTTTSWPSSAVESDDKGELKPLPIISRYSLQFDVQIVWKGNQLITTVVPIACNNYLRVDYIMTEYHSGTKWEGYWWTFDSRPFATFQIDLGLLT
jgi:hypothetical protein